MVTVRGYEPGDESVLSQLFNRAHERYAGVGLRSPEAWLWSVVKRPGVGPGRVVVAERSGHPTGYAAIDHNGTVWEAVIDPTDTGHETAQELVGALTLRADDDGVDRVVVNAPSDDHRLRSALERAGFVGGAAPLLVGILLDVSGLVTTILNNNPLEGMAETIQLEITDRQPWHQRGLVFDTGASAVVTDDAQPTLRIRLPARVLDRLVLEGRSPFKEIAAGRIRVRPLTKVPAAIRALHTLRVTDPWFYPLGDML